MDQELHRDLYPLEDKPPVKLKIGKSRPGQKSVNTGKSIFSSLSVRKKARYTVETKGRTDVVMTLSGRDDRTKLVAEDDDSGGAGNAKSLRIWKEAPTIF